MLGSYTGAGRGRERRDEIMTWILNVFGVRSTGLIGLMRTLTLNQPPGNVYFSPQLAEGQTEERSFWASRRGRSAPSSACNSDLTLEVQGTVRRSVDIK